MKHFILERTLFSWKPKEESDMFVERPIIAPLVKLDSKLFQSSTFPSENEALSNG